MQCPICNQDVPEKALTCEKCHTNLTEYMSVYYRPDALFNEALSEIRRARYDKAESLLSSAHFYRPEDREVTFTLARCAARNNNHQKAADLVLELMEEDEENEMLPEVFVKESELASVQKAEKQA